MVLTDTHTHQYYETDPEKKAALMQRCLDNGISRLFLPNVDASSIAQVMDMVNTYPEHCFPMLGLHPCDVKANYEEELDAIHHALEDTKVYAIGEIGIDLYWDKTFIEQQRDAFTRQIGWAKERDLPINIHCRNAFDEVYAILQQQHDDKLKGIFHCFSGTVEQARQIIDLGLSLGIGGVVTYKNGGLDKVVEQIALQHIVLETDSPYLTPVPYRGKPNESSYLIYVAQKVADLHQTSVEEVARITTENSKIIFGV
ncbi:TatD family hydrolase [Mucilaginibacter daejeonensis]|uniref:TatD family hydrolase n=1 Tax=Mucilaginibacter daejeonensis TaxID=398049 RepID=UPI001D178EE5|nr:TatD family hydrolase [Mucilaginibacter daejeonensis]UEG52780.1 TatD family hydrolase [Mucilaginibacter daejeonensis]